MVKAANWLTHFEYDTDSPVWSHWIEFQERNFSFIRYDERGCGLSDRRINSPTIENWVEDLRAVIQASDVERPFYLLGISQGTASSIAYSIRYPEDVAGLILVGGYARGPNHRGASSADLYKAVVDVFRLGWEQENPAFQDVFTSRFVPDAPREQRRWYTDLCQKTLSPETGADLLMARADVNIESLLPDVVVPTLVVHAENDQVVHFEEGQLLAQRIPGARMAVVEGKNHIFQVDESAWSSLVEAISVFTGTSGSLALTNLTDREQEVLKCICMAKSNKEIARDINVSEKTIRNHTSNLFAKLGLENRQHAIREFGSLF